MYSIIIELLQLQFPIYNNPLANLSSNKSKQYCYYNTSIKQFTWHHIKHVYRIISSDLHLYSNNYCIFAKVSKPSQHTDTDEVQKIVHTIAYILVRNSNSHILHYRQQQKLICYHINTRREIHSKHYTIYINIM